MRIRAVKFLWRPLELVVVSVVKTVLTCALFVLCAGAVMRWMGYDVPGFDQMQEYFRSVGRLSDVL